MMALKNLASKVVNGLALNYALANPFFTETEQHFHLRQDEFGRLNLNNEAVTIVKEIAESTNLNKLKRRLRTFLGALSDSYIKNYIKERHAKTPFSSTIEEDGNPEGLTQKEMQNRRVDCRELVELAVQFRIIDSEIATIIIESGIHLSTCLFGDHLTYEFADYLHSKSANISDEALAKFVSEYITGMGSTEILKEQYAFRGLNRFVDYMLERKPDLLMDFVGQLEGIIENPLDTTSTQQWNATLILSGILDRLEKDAHPELAAYVRAVLAKAPSISEL